jgi:hypothetical protein
MPRCRCRQWRDIAASIPAAGTKWPGERPAFSLPPNLRALCRCRMAGGTGVRGVHDTGDPRHVRPIDSRKQARGRDELDLAGQDEYAHFLQVLVIAHRGHEIATAWIRIGRRTPAQRIRGRTDVPTQHFRRDLDAHLPNPQRTPLPAHPPRAEDRKADPCERRRRAVGKVRDHDERRAQREEDARRHEVTPRIPRRKHQPPVLEASRQGARKVATHA